MQKPRAILAFATDGILSRAPLDLPISERLGEWDPEEFDATTLLQSGVYRFRKADGSWVTRGRGYAERSVPWDDVDVAWPNGTTALEIAGRDQFVGIGRVLATGKWDLWRSFIRVPKNLQLTATGKRWDRHPPRRWTRTDNPATRPRETEPTDPFLLWLARGADGMESTPWVPKFEDPGALTAEEGETLERL